MRGVVHRVLDVWVHERREVCAIPIVVQASETTRHLRRMRQVRIYKKVSTQKFALPTTAPQLPPTTREIAPPKAQAQPLHGCRYDVGERDDQSEALVL